MNTIIVDYRASKKELYSLNNLGFNTIKTHKLQHTYEAINGHPDIQVLPIAKDKLILHKDSPTDFIKILSSSGIECIPSHSSVGGKYPHNISLNCVLTDDIFIHNLKYTDKSIIPIIQDKICINVSQGYSKCATAVVNNRALMTSDPSIITALKGTEIDVLELPYGDIELEGFNYGFIGGTCGLISHDTLAFFGSLDHYSHKKEVLRFLVKHDVKPLYLNDGPLIDRGSLFSFEAR